MTVPSKGMSKAVISEAIRDLQPIRRGGDVFITLNGAEVKLSPMQANLIMRAWVEAVGAAYVAQNGFTTST